MRRAFFLFLFAGLFANPAYPQDVIRINQLGYEPGGVKIAVAMSDSGAVPITRFELRDALTDDTVWTSTRVEDCPPWGKFPRTYRLDFSNFRLPGAYSIATGSGRSPDFRIRRGTYSGTADFLLQYVRQQRCGFNPFLRDSCHTRDGYIIYHPSLDSSFIDVVGGWHDASDYLQYVTTSASAMFQMMLAWQQSPSAFSDLFNRAGLAGANGVPDILDEARWGLDWLQKMFPADTLMFNQIADDRDHQGFRLPTEDPVDYGRGKERPVYFASGKPQGIFAHKNRTTGLASTAGKFSSTFALGAEIWRTIDPEFSRRLAERAEAAYRVGTAHPGVCQTAPCRAPYFYEEDNWVDDMELAAAQLGRLTGEARYWKEAVLYGRQEPVSPWLGTDSARHYQWYPFVNLGHALLASGRDTAARREFIENLKRGIGRVAQRAGQSPFRFGTPFNWCSNNYVSSFLSQLLFYRTLSGDTSYQVMEAALRDWLFGCNPWGTSMIVGLPGGGTSPRDPHSAFTHVHGYPILGGLVDGPVRTTIFRNLRGVALSKDDPFAEFQSDIAVYHDDWADYSTNEPTLDGTAGLTMYLGALEAAADGGERKIVLESGGIVRMDSTTKEIHLIFSAHEFGEGGEKIRSVLKAQNVKASFFFTGDFYRNPRNAGLVAGLRRDGHYLGPHSDKHLLYVSWANRLQTLVSKDSLLSDLRANYEAMRAFGISKQSASYFLPPYEWYNQEVADWCSGAGVQIVSLTPGSITNADYTIPSMGSQYRSSRAIMNALLKKERESSSGLNGCILLLHAGTHPERTDRLYDHLSRLLSQLKRRGYAFKKFGDSADIR